MDSAAQANPRTAIAVFVEHKHGVAQTIAHGVNGPIALAVEPAHRAMYRSKRADRALVSVYPELKHARAMLNASGTILGRVATLSDRETRSAEMGWMKTATARICDAPIHTTKKRSTMRVIAALISTALKRTETRSRTSII